MQQQFIIITLKNLKSLTLICAIRDFEKQKYTHGFAIEGNEGSNINKTNIVVLLVVASPSVS